MKQRLLSMFALAAFSIASWAQSWTAPVAPVSPAQGVDYEADGSTSYFLYNVGCGQFVTGANSWATQISLGTNGKPYMELVVEPMEDEDATTWPDCVKLKLNGRFLFTGGNNRTDYPVENTYLFRDSEGSGFIDRNNQECWYWKFTKAESGNYYWQSAYNADEETYMKFETAPNDYAAGKTAGAAIVFNAKIEDANIEWAFVPTSTVTESDMAAFATEMELYNAKLALYNKLNEAQEHNVATDAAAAVYNNAAATIDQLKAATTTLGAAVTRAIVLAMIPEASEDNPLDITEYTIVNPSFEDGMEPWTITEGMGQNLQVQATRYENGEVAIQNFIEAWYPTSTGALKDGFICQSVSGLPEGRYRIECDVMAVWQGAALDEDPRGIYLFYNNGSYTVHSETLSTDNELPEHFSFDFDYAGDATMTIGLMAENTNMNWMGMDNFKLFAIGECQDSPAYTALVVEYNAANDYLSNVAEAEKTAVQALEDALDNAVGLVNAGSDKSKSAEYTAAIDAIKNANKTLSESVAKYKEFDKFIKQLQADDQQYTGTLRDRIEDLLNQYEPAWENGTMTSAEIDAAIAGYQPMMKQYVQEAFNAAVAAGQSLSEPIDITLLFDDMSFAYGTTQTAFASGYPAANEETGVVSVWIPLDENGNAKSEGNFKTNYSTAEVWNNRPFNISRTFTNLPKGRYTIQTNAFYRVEANDANYDNYMGEAYEGEYAYLYAGDNHSALLNVAEIAVDDEERANALSYQQIGETGIYIPNSQASASKVFADAEFAAKTLVSASGNVLNDGDELRVGVAGTDQLQGNQWTVWYGFKLFYNGAVSADDLNKDLLAKMELVEGLNTHNVREGETKLADALANAQTALTGDADAKTAAMAEIDAVIEYAKKSGELVEKIMLVSYDDKISEVYSIGNPEDTKFDTLLGEIAEAINTGLEGEFESNAQLEGWLNELPKAWVNYVLSVDALGEATVDSPIDLTLLIENAELNGTKEGWTLLEEGKSGTDGDGCVEYWNTTSFNIYQTLPTLRNGYYRLSVDALYRYGNTADEVAKVAAAEEVPNNEYLYVNTLSKNVIQWSDTENGAYDYDPGMDAVNAYNEETFWTTNNKAGFVNMCEDGRYLNVLDFGYGVEGGLTGEVTLGLKKDSKLINNDWCPFKNFRLEYLGTTAPDAIQGVAAKATAKSAAIYTIDGRQQSTLRRGINIVKMNNGSVEKVLVK